MIADAVITDYSSTITDFMCTGKPAFIFAYDYDSYKKVREFYIPLNQLPFPFATNNCDLVTNIVNFNANKFYDGIHDFAEKINLHESGHATVHVLNYIRKICNKLELVENNVDTENVTKDIERQRRNCHMKRVITYGTFDLLHYGHINLLRRAKALGDYLIVALSTDEFNWNEKQKKCYFSYEKRKALLEAIRYVDLVIPETCWEQKKSDVHEYHIDTFTMGDDWQGKFDFLKDEGVEVVYLPRTPEISSSQIKSDLRELKNLTGGGIAFNYKKSFYYAFPHSQEAA